MNSTLTIKNLAMALAVASCAACGTGLHLTNPQSAANASSSSAIDEGGSASSPNQTGANAGDTNVTANSNDAANGNNAASQLKCRDISVNGGQIVYCSCSTDNGQVCPIYNSANDSNGLATAGNTTAADANGLGTDANGITTDSNNSGALTAGSHTFKCNTQAVTGGYIYTCNCGNTRNPGDNSPGCPAFYNPADANAQAPTTLPTTTCQTQVNGDVGSSTTCTCADSVQTGPCEYYQGNSYMTSAAPYQEVCTSVLTAGGVTTSCSCDAYQQASGATCPTTFNPQNNVQPWD